MKKLLLISLSIVLTLYSCGGSKKMVKKQKSPQTDHKTTVDKKSKKEKKQIKEEEKKDLDYETVKYIARFQNIAKREMKEYGIPVSITLAQGILESKAGQSKLAVEGNNHFGIKCHKNWKGKTILHDDNKSQECFRKYINPEESYKDHSRFLAKRKRYAFLFRLPKTDYEAWARGLKKAGYATDPTYPDKLIYIIEKYGLARMDKEVLQQMSVKVTDDYGEDIANKKKKFIYEVKEGETLFTISHKFHIPVKDIQRINNLNEFDIYQGQILVLTENDAPVEDYSSPVQKQDDKPQPEKIESTPEVHPEVKSETQPESPTTEVPTSEASVGSFYLHQVEKGETLFSIAQKYHTDVNVIKKINALKTNEISVGSMLKIPADNTYLQVSDEKDNKTENRPEKPVVNDEKAVYHVVKPGETLYRIHVNYNVPVSQLRKLNHLKGNNIKVGQKLRVK